MHHGKKALTLSIIIPAYNEERYLAACLESIAKQTEKPDEVIVVDNNSSDNTAVIARSFSFVTLHSEERQGSVFASYAGMQAAQGTIIGRIDADSHLAPDWVATVKQHFIDYPEAAAITGKCYFADIPFPVISSAVHSFFYYSLQKLIAGTDVLWGSNMAIRASAWSAVRDDVHVRSGIDEDIDTTLCLQRRSLLIMRSKKLLADVSMRIEAKNSPKKVFKYLNKWPRDYFTNGYRLRGACIWVLMIITNILVLPGTLYQGLKSLIKAKRSN